MADMRHSTRATAALQALTEADPALATLALWCQHRDDDATTLAHTAGTEIRYGPGFAALPLHEQIGVAGHHILHVALQHSARMQEMGTRMGPEFDPEIWQIGCDALVNEAVLAAGHALPRPTITLKRLMRVLGEAADPAKLLAEWDAERLYHMLHLSQSGGRARGQAGDLRSAARAQGFQPDLSPAAGEAEARDAPDNAADGSDWRAHLTRALALGRAAGIGLGALGTRLADLPQPRVPWELWLRRLLMRAMLARPLRPPPRPSRRWLALAGRAVQEGATLPPWQAGPVAIGPAPKLVIALDCSGSIPTETLRRFLAETGGMARRMQAEITLLGFDEAIRFETPLSPADWRRTLESLDLPEGGGTDFAPVLARAEALHPSALVILSDLDGPLGPRRPPCPVIWASPAPEPREMPFGTVLSLAR